LCPSISTAAAAGVMRKIQAEQKRAQGFHQHNDSEKEEEKSGLGFD
jgi:hypothetical protein